jgi:hypothetical protein
MRKVLLDSLGYAVAAGGVPVAPPDQDQKSAPGKGGFGVY